MQFFAVWLSPLANDSKEAIDATILDDSRVEQYWDATNVVGRYFAEADVGGLGGGSEFVYDAYYVFGPGAAWTDAPGPVVDARRPVLAYPQEILTAIRT